MGNMVTNVYEKFDYNLLCTEKALGSGKSDSSKNNKNKNNICSAWGPFPVSNI